MKIHSIATVAFCALLLGVRFQAHAQTQFSTVHNFTGADGAYSMAGLIEGPDGALYGTTTRGGNSSLGTVFRLDPATGTLTTLHHFAGADGAVPYAGVIQGRDGLLYGLTSQGGNADTGTVFRLNPVTLAFTTLHHFAGNDGAVPDDAWLTQGGDGALYGTTSEGGAQGGGTLFRLDAGTQTLTTLYDCPVGADAGLMLGRDGNWYGTYYTGGSFGGGIVFRFDPATRAMTTLHEFAGSDGLYPVPGCLMQGSDGMSYGTTQMGSASNGSVYRLNPVTLDFTTLHNFTGLYEGRYPLAGVIEGKDGALYGTTILGGFDYGTVYRVDPVTLEFTTIHYFAGSDGGRPYGQLVQAKDGSFYGTTLVYGAYSAGTVFRIRFGDTTPPVISSITATPNVLRPPNHRMVPVTIALVATDDTDPAPTAKITGVTCNEQAPNSWLITGDLTLKLRADRWLRGTGRIYTITVQCTDASGNAATGTVTVTVPKR